MAAEKLLSGLRKLPKITALSKDDRYQIATRGALAWLRMQDEGRDWDTLAESAAGLFMAGYEEDSICETLGITKEELHANVDMEKVRGFLHSEVARNIYSQALSGDQKMLQFVAERKMGWHKVTDLNQRVSVNGEISVRPILNMQLLSEDEISRLKNERASDGEAPMMRLPGGVAVLPAEDLD